MGDVSKTEGPEKRIRAALKLWSSGDKEDAAALIFLATAAISRIRYPRELGCSDSTAFTEFVKEQIATITNGASPTPLRFPKTAKLPGVKITENVPLEDVFYGCWRCVMIHEARWPPEVFLAPTREDSDYSTFIDLPPDGTIGLPEAWLLGLAYAVEHAAEIVVPRILKFPSFCIFSGPVDWDKHGSFQIRPGVTKIPRTKVRNQDAIPVFTDEDVMKAFVEQHEIPDLAIGQFPDANALREFIMYGTKNDRFIFNPVVGERALPSYSLDTVLSSIE